MEDGWGINKDTLNLDGDVNVDAKKDVLRTIENTSDIYYYEWRKGEDTSRVKVNFGSIVCVETGGSRG